MSKLVKLATMFLLAMVVFASPVQARAEQQMINVNGMGSISIEPDVAHITLGVETQEDTAVEAQRVNTQAMEAVIATIVALGVDESDIQSAHFWMHPRHDWTIGTGEVIGYQINNSIRVTVRDIDMVGTVLTTATEAGANTSSQISFDILDGSAPYNQALAKAVADARAKAQVIADAMGVRLGAMTHVTETSWAGFAPVDRFGTGWHSWSAFQAAPVAAADAFGVPIQAGELTVTAQVSITFAVD